MSSQLKLDQFLTKAKALVLICVSLFLNISSYVQKAGIFCPEVSGFTDKAHMRDLKLVKGSKVILTCRFLKTR